MNVILEFLRHRKCLRVASVAFGVMFLFLTLYAVPLMALAKPLMITG